MDRIESTTRAARSVEDIFSFLSVADNHARFIPNMAEFKQASAGAFGQVGATARGLLRYLGIINIKVTYEIIEYEPNHRLAMKGKMGPILFKDGYDLALTENGTLIKFWVELNPTGWTTIFRPFARLIGRIHAMETLAKLKNVLETGGR